MGEREKKNIHKMDQKYKYIQVAFYIQVNYWVSITNVMKSFVIVYITAFMILAKKKRKKATFSVFC